MASPHQTDGPFQGDRTDLSSAPEDAQEFPDDFPDSPGGKDADGSEPAPPHVLRLRVATWDVVCTIALLTLLLSLATVTTWPSKLFGFIDNVCQGETCGLVPYGIDMYIYPVVWGGIGAAIAAAGIGPFVSLLKGWYMSFWPVLALAILMFSSVTGSILTTFSERYWL
jgi:hypothetical protein